ncbi:MAG: hypothetical protein PHG23_00660 [Candidatus Pacebacteria bacterium]|nr:hypothetical protein [Candidatus Paceibacterota bacterium]
MDFGIKQLLGVILIVVGLFVVFWTMYTSYLFFTAQAEFPQVFSNSAAANTGNNQAQGTMQDQINAMLGDQMKQFIPEGTVTGLLNITSWSIFAFIFIYGGIKIASLGNDFLKRSSQLSQPVQPS